MPRSFRIAVDANPVTRPAQTGTEVYARELARRLPATAPDLEWVFYASRPGTDAGVDMTLLPGRRLWSQARLPVELWGRRPDLFFAPSHVVPFLAPGLTLTVVHDLAFERFPAAYRPFDRWYLRRTTRWALRRCPIVVAVSESTRRDLVELYGADPERVVVVHSAATPPPPGLRVREARLAELGVRRPFALHVGRVEPRKNQLGALAAVERVPGLTLVSAGPVIDAEIANRLRASQRALVLGRVEAGDLELLYRTASALVFPSLYEGFGFPILEAMHRGLPVVTVRASSLAEVGGEAALYVDDPDDAEGLTDALRSAVEDAAVRKRLVAAGRRQARGFSWERTAAGVVEVMRGLLAR
ncbi:MAG TPA: glycosyltransferase family 1 protein [Candidatus Dormibacteraeota bacterium]